MRIKKKFMKRIFPLLFLLLPLSAISQIDTEFWFAAPDLTKGTGFEPRRDSSIFIVVSALNAPASVVISQPANPGFAPIFLNLAANSTQQVNLGLFLSQIESKPANAVLNTGLLVRASKPVTAYYEVRSNSNTDIWTLKGKNALGTKFYTPYEDTYGSNQFLNGNPYIPGPRAGFIVIASDDSTNVTITPKVDVLGHPANEPFTVFLMRGETYYVEAIDEDPANKPIGTLIESDKPVAVTLKDDMIDLDLSSSGGADVAGDQLFSYEWAGLRHIAVRGNLLNNGDRVVVLATVDGTEVFIDGSTDPILLNEGEQHVYNFDGAASYIEGTEKLYVFHASGTADQLCGAIIPPLECTGSNQVGFVRSNSNFFALNITIRAGSEGNFELNGNASLVPASAFQPVPGTDGEYVWARISFPTSAIASGSTNLLTNFSDELFHLGVSNRSTGDGINYGYFSAFSFLNIGENSQVCIGDTLTLDAGPGKTAYLWNTGEETQTIEITDPGTYYVEVFSGSDCSATDTILVTYYEPPIDLGPNDTICDGTTLTLTVEGNYQFTWQDGSTNNFFEVTDAGIFWVEVSDFQQCTLRDSIEIFTSPRPDPIDVEGDLEYCEGETIALSLPDVENAAYRFIHPDGTVFFSQVLNLSDATLDDAGLYQGFYIIDGCESFADSVNVVINPTPQVVLPEDQEFCEGESFLIEPEPVDGNYLWSDNSNNSALNVTESGTYYLDVTNTFGCVGSDTIVITVNPLPEFPLISGESAICEGQTLALSTPVQAGATYAWAGPDGLPISGESSISLPNANPGQSGQYTVVISLNGCDSEPGTIDITVNPSPSFSLLADTTICAGSEILLEGPDGFVTYEWSNGASTTSVSVGAGAYSLVVFDEIGCFGSAEVTISETAPEGAFEFSPPSPVTPGTVVSFTDLSEAGENPLANWFWQFGDGAQSNIQNPQHNYPLPGIYEIIFAVFDEAGCESIVRQNITVKFDFEIPEGFSPNGDGRNDLFVINGLEEFPGSSVQIFNRWGQVVFESNNYQNNWDGKDAVDGTYFYVLKLSSGQDLTGTVILAR
jgi:gliding motility-associated-like protein